MTPRQKAFLNWCRRYISVTLLVVIVLLILVLFLNDNSVVRTYEYRQEIVRLKEEIKANTDSLDHYRQLNADLETDRQTMERIVREQYHMQRPNEDVYLVK